MPGFDASFVAAGSHTAAVPDTSHGQRLDRFLAEQYSAISRSRLKQLIEDGRVQIDGETVHAPSYRVRRGQAIALSVPEAAPAEPVGQALPLDILYEDDALIVLNKPAGMVVHPAPGNPDSTLVNALIAHCGDSLSGIGGQRRPGIVHRLDKDTSGVMVAAKTDAAHAGLQALFQSHDIDRHYAAVVWGEIRGAGTIRTTLGRHPLQRKKMAVNVRGGREAVTHYAVTEHFGTLASRVDCRLETGRTHQIRVHLAHIGHPIVGDRVYGRARRLAAPLMRDPAAETILTMPRQALHAYRLGFRHPVSGEILKFETPLPHDIEGVCASMRALSNK